MHVVFFVMEYIQPPTNQPRNSCAVMSAVTNDGGRDGGEDSKFNLSEDEISELVKRFAE